MLDKLSNVLRSLVCTPNHLSLAVNDREADGMKEARGRTFSLGFGVKRHPHRGTCRPLVLPNIRSPSAHWFSPIRARFIDVGTYVRNSRTRDHEKISVLQIYILRATRSAAPFVFFFSPPLSIFVPPSNFAPGCCVGSCHVNIINSLDVDRTERRAYERGFIKTYAHANAIYRARGAGVTRGQPPR